MKRQTKADLEKELAVLRRRVSKLEEERQHLVMLAGFESDLQTTLEGLSRLRTRVCCYLNAQRQMCDCKYGVSEKRPKEPEGTYAEDGTYLDSEKTGCPEIRSAIGHLTRMAEVLQAVEQGPGGSAPVAVWIARTREHARQVLAHGEILGRSP